MRTQPLEIVTVYGSFRNNGDGSVHMKWFLSLDRAEYDQDHLDGGWSETCIEYSETFKGSNIHQKACANENQPRMTETEEYDAEFDTDENCPPLRNH